MSSRYVPSAEFPTYGSWLRSKNPRVVGVNSVKGIDKTAEKQWDKDLDFYASARRQGIQPATTKREDVQDALILSDSKGEAFQA